MALTIMPTGDIAPDDHVTFEFDTLDEVVDAIGGDEAGEARFDFALDFAHANGRITRVDLTLTLTIALPVWSNVADATAAERNEWNRFLRALRFHEDGHIAIYRREAATTYNRLLASTPRGIRAKLTQEKNRIKRLSRAYDTNTGHGTTQETPHGTTIINVP